MENLMSEASIQDRNLWATLSSYEFDPPDATIRFADKVAQDNGWSAEYTGRVIDEYRRFLFLVATGEGRASPIDAVDQVWHRHLMYTRDYWDRLCGQVLCRPLHHEPSRSVSDGSRFADWKLETLTRYREIFGEPPSDIWGHSNGAKHPAYRGVDTKRYWIVPRLSVLWPKRLTMMGLLALPFVAAGCSVAAWTVPGGSLNPLNWSRPAFLVAFVIAWFGVFGLAAGIRFRFRGSGTGSVIPMIVGALAPLLGAVKIVVGMSRGRPVGILAVLTVVSGVSLLAVFGPNGVLSVLDGDRIAGAGSFFSSMSTRGRRKGKGGQGDGWGSSFFGGGSSCGSSCGSGGGGGGCGGGGCGGCSG